MWSVVLPFACYQGSGTAWYRFCGSDLNLLHKVERTDVVSSSARYEDNLLCVATKDSLEIVKDGQVVHTAQYRNVVPIASIPVVVIDGREAGQIEYQTHGNKTVRDIGCNVFVAPLSSVRNNGVWLKSLTSGTKGASLLLEVSDGDIKVTREKGIVCSPSASIHQACTHNGKCYSVPRGEILSRVSLHLFSKEPHSVSTTEGDITVYAFSPKILWREHKQVVFVFRHNSFLPYWVFFVPGKVKQIHAENGYIYCLVGQGKMKASVEIWHIDDGYVATTYLQYWGTADTIRKKWMLQWSDICQNVRRQGLKGVPSLTQEYSWEHFFYYCSWETMQILSAIDSPYAPTKMHVTWKADNARGGGLS